MTGKYEVLYDMDLEINISHVVEPNALRVISKTVNAQIKVNVNIRWAINAKS